jgi:hypothetical protein
MAFQFYLGSHRSSWIGCKRTCHSNDAASSHVPLFLFRANSLQKPSQPYMQYSLLTHCFRNSPRAIHSAPTAATNTMTPPSIPQYTAVVHTELSPADCRTLKKLLSDTQTPSPHASPTPHKQDERLLSTDLDEDDSSDTGAEDEMQYTEPYVHYANEREDGYVDEDDSMELSDTSDKGSDDVDTSDHEEAVEQGEDMYGEVEDGMYVWSDGDNIEDVLNTPGTTTPGAPEQDFSGVYGDEQCMSGEDIEIKARRAELEKEVEFERVDQGQQEQHEVTLGEAEGFGPDAFSDEGEDNGADLAEAIEALQAKVVTSVIPDEEVIVELEVCAQVY